MYFSCRIIKLLRQCGENCAKHLSCPNISVTMYPKKVWGQGREQQTQTSNVPNKRQTPECIRNKGIRLFQKPIMVWWTKINQLSVNFLIMLRLSGNHCMHCRTLLRHHFRSVLDFCPSLLCNNNSRAQDLRDTVEVLRRYNW